MQYLPSHFGPCLQSPVDPYPPLTPNSHPRPLCAVWFLVSLVGSTACATFSYIFPGLLVLRREAGLVRRGAAGGMVCLGACMGSIAVYNTLSGHGGL